MHTSEQNKLCLSRSHYITNSTFDIKMPSFYIYNRVRGADVISHEYELKRLPQ